MPDPSCNPPECPHGMRIEMHDSASYIAAWQEEQRTGIKIDPPLPPFCRCCGQPIILGHTYCAPCSVQLA